MKTIAIVSLIILCGCGASVHTEKTQAVVAVPPAKVTKTTTVTTRVDQPVPVYKIDSTVTSQTQTVGGSTDLHKVEIVNPTK